MRLTLATAVALAMMTGLAAAGVPKDGLDVANAAYKKLDDRANQTRTKDALPRWSNADDRMILEQLWNAPAIIGAPPYRSFDLQALINIAEIENSVLRSYVLYAPNPAKQPDPTMNIDLFQDEILRAQAFSVRLSAAMLAALNDLASHAKFDQLTGEKGNNLKELRVDLMERVYAAEQSIVNADLKPENRAMLVDALADSGDEVSVAATPDNRDQFADTVTKAMPSLTPAEQERLKPFVSAMTRKDCQTLCNLQ